ncbi:MAG: hypothetical protein ACREUB_09085 [Burkholderiales bacterium]
MAVNESLRRLVDLSATCWAGEAEVARTYFQSPRRSKKSDLTWLARQCYKEMWGSGVGDRKKGLFLGPVEQLRKAYPRIDRGVDRHEVLEIIDGLRAEFYHYCLFADVHDYLSGGKLDPRRLESWPADDELARLRYAYRDQRGRLGYFAVRFTEGGYCSLYSTGMRLKGTGELNDRIAHACEKVYTDEIGHMREGFIGLAREKLTRAQWDEIGTMSRKILLQRIHMRNEQFDFPLTAGRIREIEAGRIEPMPFDYTGLE